MKGCASFCLMLFLRYVLLPQSRALRPASSQKDGRKGSPMLTLASAPDIAYTSFVLFPGTSSASAITTSGLSGRRLRRWTWGSGPSDTILVRQSILPWTCCREIERHTEREDRSVHFDHTRYIDMHACHLGVSSMLSQGRSAGDSSPLPSSRQIE
jgi:hypothetical protein